MKVMRRFIGVLGAMALAGAWPAALAACPVCFQVEPNATTAGVHAAVITLVVVTVGVLTGFGIFIARFVKRAAVAED
jgi:hypothetical protein